MKPLITLKCFFLGFIYFLRFFFYSSCVQWCSLIWNTSFWKKKKRAIFSFFLSPTLFSQLIKSYATKIMKVLYFFYVHFFINYVTFFCWTSNFSIWFLIFFLAIFLNFFFSSHPVKRHYSSDTEDCYHWVMRLSTAINHLTEWLWIYFSP